MNYYRQCVLTRKNEKGWETQVAWIPEEMSTKKALKIKTKRGWSDGWGISYVGTRMNEKSVVENSYDYKRTRKASDI